MMKFIKLYIKIKANIPYANSESKNWKNKIKMDWSMLYHVFHEKPKSVMCLLLKINSVFKY